MKIGFTGTREGMTEKQKFALYCLISDITKGFSYLFHHGCCVGADIEAHEIAVGLALRVVAHPPIDMRLAKIPENCWEVKEKKPYLERNRDIVNDSDFLIAAIKSTIDHSGGTWHAINYAKRKKKNVYIITPDGELI